MIAHRPSGATDCPIVALCLLCHKNEELLPFYLDRMGFEVRRREEGFIQLMCEFGVSLCLWEIGHIRQHIGYEVWPVGDRTGKVACTVEFGSEKEVDAQYLRLTSAGIEISAAPKTYSWNAYAFYFADPDGNCWEFYHWHAGGPKGDV
jgi:catechol-2,3-dioxygenase